MTTILIIDGVALLIIAYNAWACAKKGFVRSIVQIAAYVVVLVAAVIASRWAAPIVYDRVAQPLLIQSVTGESAPADEGSGGQSVEIQVGKLDLSSVDFRELGLPFDLSGLDLSAVDLGEISLRASDLLDVSLGAEQLEELISGNSDFSWLPQNIKSQLFERVCTQVIRPVAVRALEGIFFVIVFMVGMGVSRLILRLLRIIDYIPLLGPFNSILGAALGIAQGALFVWLIVTLALALLSVYPQGLWGVDKAAIESTLLTSRFITW